MKAQLSEVFCSIQRALLDHITPNLRAVYVELVGEVTTLKFYYDLPPSEVELELSDLADTEFIADFPRPEFATYSQVITLPFPKELPKMGHCVYRRHEISE